MTGLNPRDTLLPTLAGTLLKEKEPEKSEEQLQCEADGGQWDTATSRCIMPKIPTAAEPEKLPETKLPTPEIIRDEETGKPSGIKLPDGRTFLGISQEEINAMSKKYTSERALPAGAIEAGTTRQLAEDTQRKISLAKNVGTIDFETASQIEEQGLNVKEYLAAGTQKALGSALAYGATGAAAGLVASAPTAGGIAPVTVTGGAVAGGAVGALKGFYDGVTANIKDQRKDLVSVKTKELKQRKTAITNYISAANANPAAADEYVAAMNVELSLVRKDYNTLLKRGNEDLEFWGSDATPQLVDYEVFFESTEPSLKLRMEQAVLKPDPTRSFLSIGEEE